MPAIPELLIQMIIKNCAKHAMKLTGKDPRATKAAPYFIKFCTAVGKGIAEGTPVVQFTTKDTGVMGTPPIPGAGVGKGIKVDAEYMSKKMYALLRDEAVAKGSKHGEWPPADDNGGKYLKAITDGIADGIKEHYKDSWILTSVHPTIYMGTGKIDPQNGSKFSGIQASLVESLILSYGPDMQGSMWPKLAKYVAQAYKDGIENKSTGEVTIIGVCVPSLSQVCGIPSNGNGTGVAS